MLDVCSFFFWFVCLCVCLFACLFACLFVCLFVCCVLVYSFILVFCLLFIYLFVYFNVFVYCYYLLLLLFLCCLFICCVCFGFFGFFFLFFCLFVCFVFFLLAAVVVRIGVTCLILSYIRHGFLLPFKFSPHMILSWENSFTFREDEVVEIKDGEGILEEVIEHEQTAIRNNTLRLKGTKLTEDKDKSHTTASIGICFMFLLPFQPRFVILIIICARQGRGVVFFSQIPEILNFYYYLFIFVFADAAEEEAANREAAEDAEFPLDESLIDDETWFPVEVGAAFSG